MACPPPPRVFPAKKVQSTWPTATTSKFWGVGWDKSNGRWQGRYTDADGKRRHVGLFDTQEAAAHAVNAAIRRAGLEGRRKTNPVVDGQLVPRALKLVRGALKLVRGRKREAAESDLDSDSEGESERKKLFLRSVLENED